MQAESAGVADATGGQLAADRDRQGVRVREDRSIAGAKMPHDAGGTDGLQPARHASRAAAVMPPTPLLERSHTGNAGKAKGREVITRAGERHYLNHQPHFSVHYYPTDASIVYAVWDEEIAIVGSNLLDIYEMLKANAPDVLRESEGPRDAALPYIEKIAYRRRL